MKRTIITALALVLFGGAVFVSTGCASSSGRYFQRTREHESHVQRDRIYNPADYRYAEAE
ncbi:MAG: hypothetical protein JSU63_00700 [Phycisphaerales bacterium]|nr:MAG: hypothetical protein JSU63_00700 [Phycisphaerales bacterium]